MRFLMGLWMGLLFPSFAFGNINRFHQVDQGIYRGSQPENDADWSKLKDLGIKTVIDLRMTDSQFEDENSQAQRFGILDIHESMVPIFYPSHSQQLEIDSILTNKKYQPIFVHCAEGKDRTGLVIGLYRTHHQHWPKDWAYEEMRAIGYNPIYLPMDIYFYRHWDKP